MKVLFSICLSCLFVLNVFGQKTDAAFFGDKEKSALFEFSKADFDSLIGHFFIEPSPLAIAATYRLDLKLNFMIDTIGRVSTISFEDFNLTSSLFGNTNDPAIIELYKGIRDSVRKSIYHSNGLWIAKEKKGIKEASKVVVKTTISKRGKSIFDETSDEQVNGGGKIYYYRVGQKKTNPDFLYNYGLLKYNEKKYKLAKVYFEGVIQVSPTDKDAYFNLALCSLDMGDVNAACSYWNKGTLLGDNEALKALKKYCSKTE